MNDARWWKELDQLREDVGEENVKIMRVPGGWQVEVSNVPLSVGWNHEKVTAVFFVPHAYPAASLGNFWTRQAIVADEPTREAFESDDWSPDGSNRSYALPDGSRGMWFPLILHVWDSNDTLSTYMQYIMRRLSEL